tara:strand:- start:1543 stop:1731 length:189 start_codon:yes stop_codon:yes gene_type:complete
LPNKNVYTDAIISVVGEYKALLKDSAKKGNKSSKISGGNNSEELIQKLFSKMNLDLSEIRRP